MRCLGMAAVRSCCSHVISYLRTLKPISLSAHYHRQASATLMPIVVDIGQDRHSLPESSHGWHEELWPHMSNFFERVIFK
jgi:hypothetical protein